MHIRIEFAKFAKFSDGHVRVKQKQGVAFGATRGARPSTSNYANLINHKPWRMRKRTEATITFYI